MRRFMRIGKGRSITLDDEKDKVYESLDDWKAEGERRFGKDIMKWKFKCPMCGHVAAVQEFADLGAKDPANNAYEECLGRYTRKGSPKEGDSSGCNWAAYGLLGIPKGGIYVFTGEDTGAHIFDFAEEEGSESHMGYLQEMHGMMMLGRVAEGICEMCATAHDPGMPHNQQSLTYQYKFYDQHGRWPTWKDAMAHCEPDVQQIWIDALKEKGVEV